MSTRIITPAFHITGHRKPWAHPASGKVYKARSYISRRATIFAITSSVYNSSWGPKRWIQLQFHSSWTWKSTSPHLIQASTQMMLLREDAESLVAALLTAISEFDRQEEEEKSGGA